MTGDLQTSFYLWGNWTIQFIQIHNLFPINCKLQRKGVVMNKTLVLNRFDILLFLCYLKYYLEVQTNYARSKIFRNISTITLNISIGKKF